VSPIQKSNRNSAQWKRQPDFSSVVISWETEDRPWKVIEPNPRQVEHLKWIVRMNMEMSKEDT